MIRRVLLIEDSRGDAAMIREALAQSDSPRFEVAVAATLAEGIEALKDAFDAVVLDLGLPDSSGLHTMRRLASAAPHLAIVVMSGTDDDIVARRCIEWGANAFLSKPQFTPKALSSALSSAIRRVEQHNPAPWEDD